MLTTRTYSEFLAQVQALCGASFSTGSELNNIMALGNLAARRAYRETQWWERYLVASEPRSATRGRVSASEDSYHVFGAGTDAANGLYLRNGTVNTKAAYRLYDADGTTELYSIEWDGSTDWQLLDVSNNVIYDITDSSATPPTSGWAANTGTVPAPLLTDLAEIDTFLSIHRFDPFTDRSCAPIVFHKQGADAVLQTNLDVDLVYVTYKKKHTEVYGDGTGGTTTAIPEEWFNYMANYAARTFQMGELRDKDSFGLIISDREVNASLEDELMRMEEQGFESISKRITTHLISDNTLY